MIVASAYRVDLLRSARTIALMVAMTAGVFYFAAVMPAFDYRYTAAATNARFAEAVTAPWPSESADRLLDEANEGGDSRVLVWDCGTASVAGPVHEARGVECRALHAAAARLEDLTYYSQALMVSRLGAVRGGVLVDTSTARRLRAGVGDTVHISWGDTAVSGSSVETIVAGLVRPTTETMGILVLSGAAGGPRLGLTLFRGEGGDGGRGAKRSRVGPEAEVTSRRRALTLARVRFESLLARNTRFVLIWLSLAVYAGYLLWDQADRMQHRQRRHATFVSMGLEPAALVSALRIEQVLLAVLTAPAGCALGAWVLVSTSDLYLPVDSIAAVAFYAVAVNVGAGVLLSTRLHHVFLRLPIASLLADAP